MPQKVIEIPGYGEVEFPDSMTDDQVNAAAAKLYKDGGASKATPAHGISDSAIFFPEAGGPLGRSGIAASDLTRKAAEEVGYEQGGKGYTLPRTFVSPELTFAPSAVVATGKNLVRAGMGIVKNALTPSPPLPAPAIAVMGAVKGANAIKDVVSPVPEFVEGARKTMAGEEGGQEQMASGTTGIVTKTLPAVYGGAKVLEAASPAFERFAGKFKTTPADINKWIGATDKDLRHGANPGAQILKENLIAPTKEATLANTKAALNNAGTELGAKLQAGGIGAMTSGQIQFIDGQQILDDTLRAAEKLPRGTDATFQQNLQTIIENAKKQFPNLAKLTPVQAHEFKKWLGKGVNFDATGLESQVNDFLESAYGQTNDAIKHAVPGAEAAQDRWQSLKVATDNLEKSIRADQRGVGTGLKPPTLQNRTITAAKKHWVAETVGAGLTGYAIKKALD